MPHDSIVLAAARREALASLQSLTGFLSPMQRGRLARHHGAFSRARKISDPDSLLLLVLFYTHADFSLRLTAWFALTALGFSITDESLRERFHKCSPWLRAMVLASLSCQATMPHPLRSRFRITDGSVLCGPGAVGTEWRVHVFFEPGSGAPTGVEVTDEHGAEGLDQGPLDPLTVVLGDRNYGRYRELKTARERGVDLLARVHLPTQPLQDATGQERSPSFWTKNADRGVGDSQVQATRGKDPPLPARLIVVPLPREKAARARQKVRHTTKHGRTPDALSLHLAGYLCLLTTLDAAALTAKEAASLYRIRWQVELFFKRAKSLAYLGKIRGGDALVETQIWGRLLGLCQHEGGRPIEAGEEWPGRAETGRPRTWWRWWQVAHLVALAPLRMLAAWGSYLWTAREQDACLRERPRRRRVAEHATFLSLLGLGADERWKKHLPQALSWRLWGPRVTLGGCGDTDEGRLPPRIS